MSRGGEQSWWKSSAGMATLVAGAFSLVGAIIAGGFSLIPAIIGSDSTDNNVDQATATAPPVVTTSIASGSTEVRIVQPFSPEGIVPTYRVVSDESGSCWQGSSSTHRREAWRCKAQSRILDPCIESPFGATKDTVACPLGPFTNEVAILRLTEPLPINMANRFSGSDGPPWALRLSNGDECRFITGATTVVAGLRLNYQCTSGAFVFGDPDRSRPEWSIFYQTRGSSELVRQPVRTSYF